MSRRGTVLFEQGEPQTAVFVIRSGTVQLAVGPGRRPLVVQVLRPGDVEGDISLLLGKPPPYRAKALDQVTCLVLPAGSFEALLVDHPAIARRWLSSVADRLARSHMRIVELLGRPLAAQAAALLLDEAVDGAVRLPALPLGGPRAALNSVRRLPCGPRTERTSASSPRMTAGGSPLGAGRVVTRGPPPRNATRAAAVRQARFAARRLASSGRRTRSRSGRGFRPREQRTRGAY